MGSVFFGSPCTINTIQNSKNIDFEFPVPLIESIETKLCQPIKNLLFKSYEYANIPNSKYSYLGIR